jgi:hypothetical protein
MAGKRTRRRRGHPKGKAFGFHGLRPAAKSGSSSHSDSSESAPSESSAPSSETTQ